MAQEDNFSVVLAEQETTYAFKMKEKRNRASNIELAASKINGTILQPYEIFSYNQIVGPRTENNGFKKAPEIVQGELVDGIGGGVCQVSGTIHSAMLHAGLIIIESKQHSRHSVYIDPGLDSTVSWPKFDLKMQNNYYFPIKVIVETYRDKNKGHLIVKIMGERKVYNTEIISTVHSKKKYRTIKVTRDDLPKGFFKVIEPGTYNIKMTRTRKIYKINTGDLLLEENLYLSYDDSDRIIVVGDEIKDD